MANNNSFPKIINPISLSFRDKSLEKDFLEFYKNKIIIHLRIAMLIALGMFSFFAWLDSFLFPELAATFFQIRFFFVAPFILISFLFSFHPSFFKHFQLIISICVTVAAFGIINMLYVGGEEVSRFYYVGLIIVFIFNYDFLKIRFLPASIVGLLIMLCYIIVALYINTTPKLLAASLFFLVSANVMGMFSSYFYEYLNRKYFYSNYLLGIEQRKISGLNLSLEKQIEERTADIVKTNKELIKAKEVAEESDRLKTVFLATMSHELRTPLNAIIGFSELMGLEEIKETEKFEITEIIKKSGLHLLGLVESMFEITLIDSGQIKVIKREFILPDFFNEILNNLKYEKIKYGKESLTISYELKNINSDLIIYSDFDKLKKILINLLKNAIIFTETGDVKFGCEVISGYHKSYLKFYVQDTGIGIPIDKIDIIFEIFRQVDDTHSRKHGGMGIGLTAVKKFVELLGGEISVDSTEGVGSTFYFTLFDYKLDESDQTQ